MSQLRNRDALLEQRKKACHAIASLPENATDENVSQALDPVTASHQLKVFPQEAGEKVVTLKDDGVTPIMVACDKAQLACLRHIKRQIMRENSTCADMWGHPFDTSSDVSGGNSALHFAAMSGCEESIDYLCSMIKVYTRPSSLVDKSKMESHGNSGQTSVKDSLIFRLLSQKNGHGDTPLMMASAVGQTSCLRHWTTTLIQSFRSGGAGMSNDLIKSRTRELFQQRNDSGDTVLSLAYGHGHADAVDFLINDQGLFLGACEDGIVDVTYEDVTKCKATLDRIENIFENLRWDSLTAEQRDEYKARREKVMRCFVMLQVASTSAAERNMERLLQTENSSNDSSQVVTNNKKKHAKSRNRGRKKQSSLLAKSSKGSTDGEAPSSDTKEASERHKVGAWGHQVASSGEHKAETVIVKIGGEKVSLPGFITMPDGTVVQPGRAQELAAIGGYNEAASPAGPGKQSVSVEEMLRERYRDEDINSQTLDAVMESLCLDASMLLLSPHGMAMKLSPSQLDAVSGILKKQMDSVDKARKIQGRLRTKQS